MLQCGPSQKGKKNRIFLLAKREKGHESMNDKTTNFISFDEVVKVIKLKHEMLSMERTASTSSGAPGEYVDLYIQKRPRNQRQNLPCSLLGFD